MTEPLEDKPAAAESSAEKRILGKMPLSQVTGVLEEEGARKRIFSPRVKDPFRNVPFSPKLTKKKKKRLPMSPKSKNITQVNSLFVSFRFFLISIYFVCEIMEVQRKIIGEKRKQSEESKDEGAIISTKKKTWFKIKKTKRRTVSI